MADDAKPLSAGFETTMVRMFKGPPELVFDCFVEPEHFAKWWGPLGCENEIYTLDARPGGQISLRMAGPGYDHVMGGEFLEIDKPKRLVFLSKAFEAPGGGWGIVNRNTIIFEAENGQTKVSTHVRVERAEGALVLGALSGMKTGWGQSLERLGDLVGGGGKMDLEISDRKVVIVRAFDARPEQIFQALTDPAVFPLWWCSGGGEIETMDVRPGGKWSLLQTSPDGSTHRFWGEYREIEPSTRLVMTQGFDAYEDVEVEYVLAEEWGRTRLTRTMRFPDNDYRDGMVQSGFYWVASDSYDTLARLLAA